MAETLRLVGYKRCQYHHADGGGSSSVVRDGEGLVLSIVPPDKGNVHFFAKWWERKANQKVYISGAKVAIKDSPYELLVPCGFSTRLRIQYDGDVFAMILHDQSEVSRVGISDIATGKVVAEYVAPRIKARNAKWFLRILDQETIDGNVPPPDPIEPDPPFRAEPMVAEEPAPKRKKKTEEEKECD